ncbi:MAG: ferrochelatase [Symploca sp. SIO2G7]|nr:ferrochelatase [Symploca sp. SIO2G7]
MVAISRAQLSTQDRTDDRVAVLLMGYGEVESYEDFANYNEQALNLLTAKFAPVPTWIYPPLAKLLALFDRHEWDHQHDHFISPHNAIFERQRAGIERHLKTKWGDRVSVFKAFNFCAPFLPHQVLADIQSQGFTKLLIYPLLVVDSIFTSGIAVEQVNSALAQTFREKADHWLQSTRYMPSFYNQPDYIALLASQVENKIQQHLAVAHLPSQTGIVLMNHGCPHKAKGFTSGIMESQLLYEAVRERLIYNYPLVSIGWLNHATPMIEWTQPNVAQAAKNLMDLGATALVLMPIGFATENHETLLDVEHIISHLRKKRPDVTYVQMPCVNDHNDFLAMAAGWVDGLISDLLGEEGVAVNHTHRAQLAEVFSSPSHDHHGHGNDDHHHSGHHHDHHHNGHHHDGHHHDQHSHHHHVHQSH